MRKKLKKAYGIFIILIALVISVINVDAQNNKNTQKEVIKVGFYHYNPYYYINEKNEYDGYYTELMDLLAKEIGIEYQYIYCDVSDALNKLKNGEVDLLFGMNKTQERIRDVIYTNHYIAIENYGVYTREDVTYGKLESLEGKKFGYIKNEANYEWIIDFLNSEGINVELVEGKSYQHINTLMNSNKIDATVSTQGNKSVKEYKKIFDYSAGPVYIASKKGNEKLINKLNTIFEKYAEMKFSPVEKLQDKYFSKYSQQSKYSLVLSIILMIIIMMIIGFIFYKDNIPKKKLKKQQQQIKNYIKDNKYLLYYQPIVNPKNNEIKGFESLLRLKCKEKILTPYHFIKNIEESDMMFDVSLWILEKAVNDYNKIKEFKNIKNNHIYISVNISFREIENDDFVNCIKALSKKLEIEPKTICLEIVEKFAMKDVKKIQLVISELREYGFLVAIDDFGVEYSNLDILEKIDCDIIKLDKYFIDDIQESRIRKEIVNFVSNLCKYSNKVVVSEGVETIEQRDIIKVIDNDKFYIQGYFYSKPLDIKDLEKLNID